MSNSFTLVALFLLFLLAACTPTTTQVETTAELITPLPTVANSDTAETAPINPARPTPTPEPLDDGEPIPPQMTVIVEFPVDPTYTPASAVTLRWRANPHTADPAFYQTLNNELDAQLSDIGLVYEPETDANIYAIKLQTELVAGVGPDVFWLPAEELAEFVHNGLVLDLRPLAEGFNTEQFYPGPMRHLTYDPATGEQGTKLWGVSSEVDALAIYLNLDLIAAVNASDPRQLAAEGNWNWDTFLQVAQAVNNPANGVYGYEQPWFWWSYGVWANAAGGSLLNADGTCGLTTAESVAGFTFAHQLYQEYQVAAPYGLNESLFLQGQAGMMLNGRVLTPFMETVPFAWEVVELPTGPVSNGDWLFWGAYVVNAYSQHPQEAWQLVQALTSAETQTRLAQLGSIIPGRLDSAEAFLTSTPNPQAFLNGIHRATAVFPNWVEGLAYDDFSCSAVTHLLNGEITLADFSTNACNQFTQASITICP